MWLAAEELLMSDGATLLCIHQAYPTALVSLQLLQGLDKQFAIDGQSTALGMVCLLYTPVRPLLSALSTAGAHSKLLQHSSCDLELCQLRVLNGTPSRSKSVTVI
ncbi:TPA: hypothetical protein ACH3X1_006871 [Trebouxia sp. C0004]